MDSASISKSTMTLAEARFKAMQSHSIPDLGVQGHVVEPLKIDKDLGYQTKYVFISPTNHQSNHHCVPELPNHFLALGLIYN